MLAHNNRGDYETCIPRSPIDSRAQGRGSRVDMLWRSLGEYRAGPDTPVLRFDVLCEAPLLAMLGAIPIQLSLSKCCQKESSLSERRSIILAVQPAILGTLPLLVFICLDYAVSAQKTTEARATGQERQWTCLH